LNEARIGKATFQPSSTGLQVKTTDVRPAIEELRSGP